MKSANQMFRIDIDTQMYPNAFTSDTMEEDENPRLDRIQEKTVVVPRIQSMKNYILKHHKRMILSELNRQIDGGTLQEIQEIAKERVTLNTQNCAFPDMNFWRYDTYTLLAEVLVCVNIEIDGMLQTYDLYCELIVDMRKGMKFGYGECGFLKDKPERDLWLLSSYLVPILRKDEVEQGAEELLLRYCPHALTDHKEHNAYVLAENMGLHVERYPLYRQSATRSVLFFCDGYVVAEEQDEDGRGMDTPYTVKVSAGTIIINTSAVHKDYCQLEIYHECIHYDWHYMFFKLQDMYNSDIENSKAKRIVFTKNNKSVTYPTQWMEWQARRGSFGLMMPLCMMEPLVDTMRMERKNNGQHAGKKFDSIARTIARDYDLPKFRVRARLLQMGYIAAKGALNYVDGRYIEPFAFSAENGTGNNCFVIDRKSAFEIYQENETFRRQIQSGLYVYADGHICVNESKYVRKTNQGLMLTSWANAHVDICCLRFTSNYEPCGIADYCFGVMNSDEEYNRHYMAFANAKTELTEKEKLSAMTHILYSLPASFPEALSFLMKQAHVTVEKLEEKACISSRTISRLRTEERRDYSLDQTIAICIALHLPPWLSREMLVKAGYVLRPTKQHRAYQMALDCLFMDTVEDVQNFLVEAGCEKLRLKNSED